MVWIGFKKGKQEIHNSEIEDLQEPVVSRILLKSSEG
jgi:hypothetical protein